MKTFLLIAVIIAPLLCAAQPMGTDIRTRRLGVDSFELVITTSQTTDVATAQNALIPTAKNICGDKEAQFGRYRFNTKERIKGSGNEPPQTLSLTQEIKCGATVSEQTQETASPSSQWQPNKKDQADIERLTYKYFQDKDSGNYENAYFVFTDSMKSAVTLESWQANARQFNSKAGKVVKRKIVKITWYNNPPTAPTPGIYAAADYVSQFENIDIHCGYIAWRQEKNGKFQIVREEQNFIDKATQASMKENDVAKIKAQYGCVVR